MLTHFLGRTLKPLVLLSFSAVFLAAAPTNAQALNAPAVDPLDTADTTQGVNSLPEEEQPLEPLPNIDAKVEVVYTEGLKAYQNQEWANAMKYWQRALELDPNNDLILHNLALASLRLDQRGYAIGLWRKALYVNPGLTPAQKGLDLALKKLDRPIAETSSFWIRLQRRFLRPVPLAIFLLLSTLCFFLAAWLWLKYIGVRREQILDHGMGQGGVTSVRFPYLAALLSFFALPCIYLTFLKWQDSNIQRATLITASEEVRTGPANDQASLFQISEGSEVLLKQIQGEWAQVSYPGGLTGWAPRTSLFITTLSSTASNTDNEDNSSGADQ